MEALSFINSTGMWLASSVMVVVIVAQSVVFLRAGLAEATRLEIPREKVLAGLRSAMITSLGPALAPVIVLFALIAVIGAPTAWMRLNDIGAARTELAMITLSTKTFGVDPQSAKSSVQSFSYALWGMALNNLGWLLVALLFTHKMSGIVTNLNANYNPKWIKYFMAGATIGLFAYLLCGQLIGKKADGWYAAIISAAAMLLIGKAFARHQRLQELALGLSMLIGMLLATALA